MDARVETSEFRAHPYTVARSKQAVYYTLAVYCRNQRLSLPAKTDDPFNPILAAKN